MKRTLFYGATALGFLFASCSSDDLVKPEENQGVGSNQTLYVNMRISGDTHDMNSRAAGDNGAPVNPDDFQDPDQVTENLINNAYFVFYDSKGEVVGDIVSIDLSTFKEDASLVNGSVEKAYSSVVPISVKKGESKPSQVICYLNPISPSTLNRSLNVIQTVARQSVLTTENSKNYFAMSNSVYYPEGESDGSMPQVAVQISENQLYTSEDAANKALGSGNTVDIYVERYATKLQFMGKKPETYRSATRIYTGVNEFTKKNVNLDFTPQYWAVNAESNSSYVIKSFRAHSATGAILGDNYSYKELNDIINTNNEGGILNNENMWDWNNPDYHRSYWGMSPSYFQQVYPEVSSDLDDIPDISQKYISYNELLNKKYGFSAANTTPQYFKETTVGSMALASDNPAAAVASVIYVGQYTLSMDGNPLPEGTSFYTYLAGPIDGIEEDHPYVYFDNKAGSTESAVAGGESMLKRFFAQQTILYRAVYSEEDPDEIVGYTRLSINNPEDVQMLTRALEVSEISNEVKIAYDGQDNTKLKLQNNTRSLQFTSVAKADGIYIVTGNGYNQIVNNPTENNQVSLLDANIAIMRQVGYAYYYTAGHGYFNIPVKHFGWWRKGNDQRMSDKINWNNVRVGDFGMVRNHSYTVTVEQILGLAQGIGDDDNPIVPPSSSEDYFMAYSVRILKWAVVPTQKVKL